MTQVPRLLIVDDDPLNIKLLSRALADMGEVCSAADGSAALSLLAERPIDLILLDIVMPGLDGFATCRALRRDHPEITVVFMTAAAEFENEIRALEAGGNDFISKPFNLPVVRARVSLHLKLMAQQAERKRIEQEVRDLNASLERKVEERTAQLYIAREAAARHASEQRLGTLVEQGLAGIAELDLEGRLIRVNDRYCEIVGHPRAALLGRSLSEFTWTADWTRNLAVLQRLTAGGPPEIFDKRYRRQDGGHVHAQVSAALVRDDAGIPAGFLCLVTDITERREAEERLRENEQRWKRALDGAGHGVWDWQIETGTVDFSSGWKTMLGYAEEDIGGEVSEWSTRIHPDDLPAAQTAVQAHLAGATPSYECIHRLRCKGGSWKWILDRGMVFEHDATGKPLRMLGTHTDISAQKEAEQKLRESEGRYRDLTVALERRVAERTAALRAANAALTASEERHRRLADHALDVIWTMDLAGHVTYVSPSVEKLRGYTPAEVMQQTLEEILTPDSCAVIRAALTAALADIRTGRPAQSFRGEVTERCRDGSIVQVETTATVMYDRDGHFLELLGVSRDITERKRLETALAASEERYRLALDATNEGLWDTDLVTGESIVSDRSLAILGYTHGEITPTLTTWKSHLHPEDAPRILQAHADCLCGRTPSLSYEYRAITKTGETRWIRDQGKIVARDADGVPLRIVGTTEDITERVLEKERVAEALNVLELATEAAGIGIWSWDFHSGTLKWDARMDDLYAVSEAERGHPLTHEDWKSRMHPDDLERTQARLEEAIHHQSSFADVFRIRLPDARVRYIQAAGVIERDATGQPRRILGINRDITAQQEQEETLRAAKQAAEAANAAKTAFLAHMSHEIRTPMNAVLGLAQVLEKAPLTADQHHMVVQIATAGRSLLGILNDILDLSKIEAGQLLIEEHPFTLPPLLDHIEALLGRTAGDKDLVLSIAEAPALAGALIGDPLRLEQVMVNLIGNAIKFTDQGEVRVRVEPRETTDQVIRLRFTVCDTGIGIAPTTQTGLFTPFTQADGSITRRFGGTGLGLSICKRLVDLMGGRIGVASTPGVGSTFWFEVPFMRTAVRTAVAATLPTPAPAEATPHGPRLAGLHLLVVDDSPMNREVVERMLALEGARATTAEDGQQALEHLRTQPQGFDAVLMDVQMPVMDGLTATRLIRTDLGLIDLPIIALTAGVLPEQQAAARAAGVDGVLAKPLDLEQLATLLSQRVGAPVSPATPPACADEDGGAKGLESAKGSNGAAEFPVIAGIDRDHAAQVTDDDRAFFLRLLQRFADDFTTAAAQTRHDLAAGERAAAARRMHSLRGSAAYIGALELMATAGGLEEAIATGESGLAGRLATLEGQLAGLIDASAAWRAPTDPVATAPVSAVHAAPPLDPDQFQALCAALRLHNFRARQLYEALEPALQGLLDDEARRALRQSMQALRFAEALAILNSAVRP
jgi:PAS domain S-box-containing protein